MRLNRRVPRERRIQVHRHQVVEAEAGIERQRPAEAGLQHADRNEQDHRQGDLGHDQHVAADRSLPAVLSQPGALQRRDDLGLQALPGRRQAEQYGAHDRCQQREGEHAEIKLRRDHDRQVGRHQRLGGGREESNSDVGESQSQRTAEKCQEQALGQQLLEQTHPADSQREPDRHSARRTARAKNGFAVRARDQHDRRQHRIGADDRVGWVRSNARLELGANGDQAIAVRFGISAAVPPERRQLRLGSLLCDAGLAGP